MKRKSLFLIIIFITLGPTLRSQGNVKFTEYNLDNGLHIILHQDNSTPIVAVSVMYHVGSKNEKPDRTGFAHFFEHLMFEGSPNIGRGEYMKMVENAGGELNANTDFDRTFYYDVLPSNQLAVAADQIKQQLQQFGPIIYYDKFGSKIDTSLAAIPGELSARDIIDHYIKAIGGRDSLANVHDRITVMNGSVKGFDVTTTIYQKEPDLFRQEVDTGNMKQDIIFNGKEGEMRTAGQVMKIEGNELEKLKYEASIHFLLSLDSLGVKLKLAGMEKVNGKDSYRIEMIFPSGTKWIQYYDPETGYKIKETKNITAPQGTFTQEIFYSDYRSVNGVKYPFFIKQSIGSQSMQFRVNSIKINTGIPDSQFEL